MNFQSKVALITGGTKGIGLAIVKALLNLGMNVCYTGRSEKSINESLNAFDRSKREHILPLVADVRDAKLMKEVSAQCMTKWGQIDLVIANAGVGHFSSIEDMSYDSWNELIDINLTGVFNTIKPTIEALKASKGYIMTIASLAGTNFFATGSAYNASKFGLVGFTQAIMLDLRKHGIKVTTIMPGSVSTYFNNRVPSPEESWKIQPEDIAQLIVNLLEMPANTLPSKVEMRPSIPPSK